MVILIFLWHLIQKISNIITFKVLNTRETLLRNSRVEVENNELSDLELKSFHWFDNKIDSSLQTFIYAKLIVFKLAMKIIITWKADEKEIWKIHLHPKIWWLRWVCRVYDLLKPIGWVPSEAQIQHSKKGIGAVDLQTLIRSWDTNEVLGFSKKGTRNLGCFPRSELQSDYKHLYNNLYNKPKMFVRSFVRMGLSPLNTNDWKEIEQRFLHQNVDTSLG